jgi:cold-inducible RNA-binding protein
MKIFVGNLPFTVTKDEVRSLFEPFGRVVSVSIVMKNKMKSRGFGFVHMPEENEALASITGLNGKEYMERALKVSMIRSQTDDEQPYTPGDQPQKSYRYKPKFTPRTGYKSNKDQFSSFRPNREEGREERPWRKSSDSSKFGRSPSRGPSKPWRRSEEPRTFNQSAGKTWNKSDKPWDKKKSVEGNSYSRPSKPWEKSKSYEGNRSSGPSKPWEKSKSYDGNRSSGPSKPWEKSKSYEGNRSSGPSKPWDKKKSYEGNRTSGSSRPWEKKKSYEGNTSSKPWQKEDSTKSWKSFSEAKPWKKSSDRGASAKPWKSASPSERKSWPKSGERKFSGVASAKPWQKNTATSNYKRKTY